MNPSGAIVGLVLWAVGNTWTLVLCSIGKPDLASTKTIEHLNSKKWVRLSSLVYLSLPAKNCSPKSIWLWWSSDYGEAVYWQALKLHTLFFFQKPNLKKFSRPDIEISCRLLDTRLWNLNSFQGPTIDYRFPGNDPCVSRLKWALDIHLVWRLQLFTF